MGLSADHSALFVADYGRGVYELPLTESTGGGAGGSVPATLALSLGGPASFGTFTPGAGKDYNPTTTADVLSTAGDAALSVGDASGVAPGHLVNGSFSLPQPLQARAGSPAAGPGGATIGANDALRTGSYSKTLTFTLSTTTP